MKASDCHGYGLIGVDWPRSKIDPVIILECCQHQVSIEQNCIPISPILLTSLVDTTYLYNLKGKFPVSRSLSVAIAIDRHISLRESGLKSEVAE